MDRGRNSRKDLPKKKVYFCSKMWRTEQSMALLLKKPSQRHITSPIAHHKSKNFSKGIAIHLPSLLQEEDKLTAGRRDWRSTTKLIIHHHHILHILVTGR